MNKSQASAFDVRNYAFGLRLTLLHQNLLTYVSLSLPCWGRGTTEWWMRYTHICKLQKPSEVLPPLGFCLFFYSCYFSNALKYVFRSVSKIINAIHSRNSRKHKNCIHLAFYTCDNVGVHSVTDNYSV